MWHDGLKTGHLTLLDNNLTNSSLSVCVCVCHDSNLGKVPHALNAFCPFQLNELNDIIFVICALIVSGRGQREDQKLPNFNFVM